jgi:hypothetical protein
VLDETLGALNPDYRAKRAGAVGMVPPLVTPLPPGTIHRWLAARGKLGDQHKVPRATSDRVVADDLLEHAGSDPPPLAPALAHA